MPVSSPEAKRVKPSVLVCFALRDEAAPFLRLLKNRRQEKSASPSIGERKIPLWHGEIAGNPLTVALTGMGPVAAEKSARLLLEKSSFAYLLSAGFAGGLRASLKGGNLIIPELVTDEAVTYACKPSLIAHRSLPIAPCSKLISVRRIVATASDKRALHKRTGVAAVDMESASLAKICQLREVPFVVVRIISDEVGEDLPVDFNLFLGEDQQPRPTKAAKHFLRHPSALAATLKMRRQLKTYAQILAVFLQQHFSPAQPAP